MSKEESNCVFKSKITQTRTKDGKKFRRRECVKCGKRWTTVEALFPDTVFEEPTIQRDGTITKLRREPFECPKDKDEPETK